MKNIAALFCVFALSAVNAQNYIVTTDTIPTLKVQMPSVVRPAVLTLGATNLADGFGGVYYWNAVSTATADNFNIVTSSLIYPTGRWIRIALGSSSGSNTNTPPPDPGGVPNVVFSPTPPQQKEYIFADESNYPATFDVTMTTTPGGYVIRWTDVNSTPTAVNGVLYTAPVTITGSYTFRAVASTNSTVGTMATGQYILERPVFWGWSSAPMLNATSIRALANRETRTIRVNGVAQPTVGNFAFNPGGSAVDYYYIAFPDELPLPATIKQGIFDVAIATDAEGFNSGQEGFWYKNITIQGEVYKLIRSYYQLGGSPVTWTLAGP